jgi:hypothetical protein
VIPPDQEIFEVEQRLAARRARLKRDVVEARERAIRRLASPMALIAAAGLGFVIANSVARRRREPPHPERRKSDHVKAAKATGLAGLITTGAMWFIRLKYGSPAQLAHTLLQKFQSRKASTSAPGDRPRATPRATVMPLRRVQR